MVYQTFWLRVAALLIDSVLLWPLMLLEDKQNSVLTITSILILILTQTYFIIGHAQYGQTLGKRILGLRVVQTHELLPLKWKHAIWRQSLDILATMGFAIVNFAQAPVWALLPISIAILIDYLIAFIHPRNRSLHDFIAKTVVVRAAV